MTTQVDLKCRTVEELEEEAKLIRGQIVRVGALAGWKLYQKIKADLRAYLKAVEAEVDRRAKAEAERAATA